MRDSDEQQTNLIIDFVVKYYKPMIIFPMIAAITALIVSFLLHKKYEAHAEIFPTYFSTLDQNLDNPSLGYDVDADRLLKVLYSETLKDSIVNKFNLVKYWDIDTTLKNYKFYLNKKFEKNIKFNRTTAMSIVITVYTYDANFSIQIVNEIINQVNVNRERMLKTNIKAAYESNKEELTATKALMDSVLIKIKNKRSENDIYYPALHQTSMFNTSNESNGAVRTDLEELVDIYNLNMDHYRAIYIKVKKAEQMMTSPIPKVYVLDNATSDFKKKSPKTVLNIVGSFIVSLILVVICILVRIEWLKKFRPNKVG
jgi:hypothetical protein